jgi:hypothetical protein
VCRWSWTRRRGRGARARDCDARGRFFARKRRLFRHEIEIS